MKSYFEQVDAQLRQAHDQLHAQAPARRSALRKRWLAVVAAVTVGCGATGAALAATGVQVPLFSDSDRPSTGQVLTTSIRVLPLRVEDPDGGAPWGIRLYRTARGWSCLDVGRVVAGRLGGFDQNGAFRELPVGRSACTRPGPKSAGHVAPDTVGLTSEGFYLRDGTLSGPASQVCSAYDQRSALRALVVRLDRQMADQPKRSARPKLVRERRAAQRSLAVALPVCAPSQLRTIAYGVPNRLNSAYLVVLPGRVAAGELRSQQPCARQSGRLVAAVAAHCPR